MSCDTFHKSGRKRKRSDDDGNVENKKMRNICPICLIELKKGTKTTTTPCKHVFCSGCLDVSLSYSSRCPLCRSLIVPVVDKEPRTFTVQINLGFGLGRRELSRLYQPIMRWFREMSGEEDVLSDDSGGDVNDDPNDPDFFPVDSE